MLSYRRAAWRPHFCDNGRILRTTNRATRVLARPWRAISIRSPKESERPIRARTGSA